MARIDTYSNDNNLENTDKLIGTDSTGEVTKNFTLQKITEFVLQEGGVGPAGPPGPPGADGDPNYDCWRAVINSNSVVNVFVDEISFTSPVITNPSNGKILITKTGFFTSLNSNKIDLITSTVNNAGTPYVCTLERYDLFPNDSLILNVFDMSGAQTGTPSINFTVEIRIYN